MIRALPFYIQCMYGVSIDRSFESAKTVKGITDFSDFESIYDENKTLQYIVARNQTRMLEKNMWIFWTEKALETLFRKQEYRSNM